MKILRNDEDDNFIKIFNMSGSSFSIKHEQEISSEEMDFQSKKPITYESGKQQGSWTSEEHLKYIIFM